MNIYLRFWHQKRRIPLKNVTFNLDLEHFY